MPPLKRKKRHLPIDDVEEITTTGSGEAYQSKYAFADKENDQAYKRLGYRRISKKELDTNIVTEELSPKDLEEVREIVRQEVALIFFQLFKKRSMWV